MAVGTYGTVKLADVDFNDVDVLYSYSPDRETLGETHASNLEAEGNCYYKKTSGIGFHGDSERKVVICLSLGKPTVLRYHWRLPGSSEHTLQPIDINIGHGDVYVMSEKATGYDWSMRSKVRVVHAAGSSKYTASK